MGLLEMTDRPSIRQLEATLHLGFDECCRPLVSLILILLKHSCVMLAGILAALQQEIEKGLQLRKGVS